MNAGFFAMRMVFLFIFVFLYWRSRKCAECSRKRYKQW